MDGGMVMGPAPHHGLHASHIFISLQVGFDLAEDFRVISAQPQAMEDLVENQGHAPAVAHDGGNSGFDLLCHLADLFQLLLVLLQRLQDGNSGILPA
jgi:hypothetical protein